MATTATQQNVGFWSSLKQGFVLLFLLTSDFITLTKPSKEGAGMFMDAETFRLLVFGSLYLISLWIIYLRRVDFFRLMRGHWMYILFLVYAFSTFLWSANPGKTIITCSHLLGNYLIATAGLLMFRGNIASLLRVYCFFSYIFIPACLITAFLFPERNIHTQTGRWMALTGNPNSLGGAAMICVWANMAYLLYVKSNLMRLWTVMMIAGAFVLLVGAGSVTSLGLSTAIVVGVPLFYWFETSRNVFTALIKISYTGLIAFIVLGYFYATQPELFEANRILGTVDRDTNLTGRSTLWEIAWKAIADKPWLGWSFDALNSLPTKYQIQYNQFHNGYLDIRVRGGWVALLFVLFFALVTAGRLVRLAATNKIHSISFGILLIVIMLHNTAETSFAAAPHPLWLLFTFLYIGVSSRNIKWYETGVLDAVPSWNRRRYGREPAVTINPAAAPATRVPARRANS